jgi:hypothetical protein
MLTARDLERVHATYTSASWRGDPAGQLLENWMRLHWVEETSKRPDSDPTAISPHGAGGRGIFWYEGSSTIYGFVPGTSGCYVFKRSESAPVAAPPRPARIAPSPRLRPVAHFQSGTYARHLFLDRTRSGDGRD